ncbi:hypothetical protein HRbin36_01834 [bacterium HR36]|nr:hypothetical protein HRbin36_01834 [bacterium HR36]
MITPSGGTYFVTICTQGRPSLFGEVVGGEMQLNDAGRIAEQCWRDIPAHFPHVELDAFVVMPNHVRGILLITGAPHDSVGAPHDSVGTRHNSVVGAGHNSVGAPHDSVGARHNSVVGAGHNSVGAPHDSVGTRHNSVGARRAVPLHDVPPPNNVPINDAVPLQERFGKPVAGSIPTIVRSFKSAVTHKVNALRGTPGAAVWQRNYYEHIIRSEESLQRIREYISTNPLRWHLDRENPNPTGTDDFDRWLDALGKIEAQRGRMDDEQT